jgi:hypothetical protein
MQQLLKVNFRLVFAIIVGDNDETVVENGSEHASLRVININKQNKLHGLSLRANYTDRATAACRRSDCQLLRIEGATCSA